MLLCRYRATAPRSAVAPEETQAASAAAVNWTRGGAQRVEGARDAVLYESHVVHIALRIRLLRRTVTCMAVAVSRSDDVGPAQRALTSQRRIPAHEEQIRRSPHRDGQRLRATWSDSTPRPRRRGW